MPTPSTPRWYVSAPALPTPMGSGPAEDLAAWLDNNAGVLRDGLSRVVGSEGQPGHASRVIQLEALLRDYALEHAAALTTLEPELRLAHLLSLHPVLQLLGEGAGERARWILVLRMGTWLEGRMARKAAGQNAGDVEELATVALDRLLDKVMADPQSTARRVEEIAGDPQLRLVHLIIGFAGNVMRDVARRERRLVGLHLQGAGTDRRPGEVTLGGRASARAASGFELLAGDAQSAREGRQGRWARESRLDRIGQAHRVVMDWETGLSPQEYATYALWMRFDGRQKFWPWAQRELPGQICSRGSFYRRLGSLSAGIRDRYDALVPARNLKATHLRAVRGVYDAAACVPPLERCA
jgi:hypothetical protein